MKILDNFLLQDLYNSGRNDYEVAAIIRVGRTRLREWREEHGVPSKTTKKNLSLNICPGIITRLKQGETLTAIAETYHASRTSISKLLKKNGYLYDEYRRPRPKGLLEYNLTAEQRSILIGDMFGDGHLWRTSSSSSYYCCAHSFHQKMFVLWKFLKYKPLSSRLYFAVSKDGKYASMATWSNRDLRGFQEIFYPQGKGEKTLPVELVSEMTPLSLAVWFMGDGSLHKKTGCFTVGRNIVLEPVIEALNAQFGNIFKATRYEKQWTVVVTDPDYFFKITGPFIIFDMSYKIPRAFKKYCGGNPPELETFDKIISAGRISFPMSVFCQGEGAYKIRSGGRK